MANSLITPFSLLEDLLKQETGQKMTMFGFGPSQLSDGYSVYCYPESSATPIESSRLSLFIELNHKKALFDDNAMPEGFIKVDEFPSFLGNFALHFEKWIGSKKVILEEKRGSLPKPSAEVSYIHVYKVVPSEDPYGIFGVYQVQTDRLRAFLQETEQTLPFRYNLSLPSFGLQLGDNSAYSKDRKISVSTSLGSLSMHKLENKEWEKNRDAVEKILPYIREHGAFMEEFAQRVKREYQQSQGLFLE